MPEKLRAVYKSMVNPILVSARRTTILTQVSVESRDGLIIVYQPAVVLQ